MECKWESVPLNFLLGLQNIRSIFLFYMPLTLLLELNSLTILERGTTSAAIFRLKYMQCNQFCLLSLTFTYMYMYRTELESRLMSKRGCILRKDEWSDMFIVATSVCYVTTLSESVHFFPSWIMWIQLLQCTCQHTKHVGQRRLVEQCCKVCL